MYSSCFHPRHSLLLTVKRHLIYIYGRGPDSCAPEQLAAKLEYCDQLLAVLDTLMPGLTRCNVTVMSGLRCHVMVMSWSWSCHHVTKHSCHQGARPHTVRVDCGLLADCHSPAGGEIQNESKSY